MTIFRDGVLAFAQSVPQLDRLIAGTGDNLTVVNGERNGEDIRRVANKPTGGGAGAEVPKPECLVPGRRKRKLTIGRDDHVLHEVVMAVKRLPGVAPTPLFARDAPDNDGFISRRG